MLKDSKTADMVSFPYRLFFIAPLLLVVNKRALEDEPLKMTRGGWFGLCRPPRVARDVDPYGLNKIFATSTDGEAVLI